MGRGKVGWWCGSMVEGMKGEGVAVLIVGSGSTLKIVVNFSLFSLLSFFIPPQPLPPNQSFHLHFSHDGQVRAGRCPL